MYFNTTIRNFLLPQRVRINSIAFYCSGKKDDTKPPQTIKEEKVTVAPKVIAKEPPIEKLTHGRIFDPVTETYRAVKVPTKKQTVIDHINTITKPERLPPLPITNKKLIDNTMDLRLSQLSDDDDDSKPKPTAPKTPKSPKTSGDGAARSTPVGGSGDGSGPTQVPRLTRLEPERVMFCLIPYTWVKAFNNKTGVTGFWTFLFTYGTYIISKEKLVMEHEYYGGLSMILLAALSMKYVAPSIAEGLDKQIDAFEQAYKQQSIDERTNIEDSIKEEEWAQTSMEEQLVVVQVKRLNVDLQLEAEFRQRQMTVYKQVKSLLDYQVAYDQIERRFAQEQMIRWTIKEVLASINDEIDSQYVDKCLAELDILSQKQQAI